MVKPSLEIGNNKWSIKEDNLLGYSMSDEVFVPQPITMTRASAGTRVNSSGLVETVELLGSELVTNGDFATDLIGWSNANNHWQWTSQGAYFPETTTHNPLSQTLDNDADVILKFTFTLNIIKGTVNAFYLDSSSASIQTQYTTSGTYTIYTVPAKANTTITFSRYGGINTEFYVDNVSVKESTKNNLARVDYDGTASSLLAEPERTNELTQSNQFDTTWIQSGTLTSGQDGVGGSTDAWKFENPGATSSLYQADTTSGVQTVSAYFKKNSNYGVRFFAFGSVNCSTYFDLNNGAVVSAINSTAKVEPVGDDWFRCSMTFDQTTSRCDFYVTNNASTQVLGDYTIQYAQLESGSYATSYIPTDSGTVTRVKDQYEKTGISNLINSEEGVLFVEMAALSDDLTYRQISLSDGTSNHRLYLQYNAISNNIAAVVKVGGSTTAYTSTTLSSSNITDFNKIGFKWKLNDFALWINGVEVSVDTNGGVPTGLNEFTFNQTSSDFYGKVKQLQVFTTALTDSELETLTTI